jgi:hypothetical protein
MPEDDYTGTPEETFSDLVIDDGFYEVSLDEDGDIPVDDDDEILLNTDEVLEGAVSLLDIATRLYDLADTLTSLSEEGWEIVDDVTNGQATIVQFATGGVVENDNLRNVIL